MFPDFNTPHEYPQLKRCVGCDNQYPRDINHFRENSHNADGYSNICYECEVTYKAKTTQKCIKCGDVFNLSSEFWHKEPRMTLGFYKECKTCILEKNSKWYESNRDIHLSRSNQWKKDNAERKRITDKKWRSENADKIRLNGQKWFENNRSKALEQDRIWRLNNPDKVRAHNNKRRAYVSKSNGIFSKNDIHTLYESQDKKCFYCGCAIVKNRSGVVDGFKLGHIDHYIALKNGGSNTIDNLVWACERCNVIKGARSIEDFASYMSKVYGIKINTK